MHLGQCEISRPLRAENLLEDTGELRCAPLEGGRSNPSVTSQYGSSLPFISADVRSSDDAIALEGLEAVSLGAGGWLIIGGW